MIFIFGFGHQTESDSGIREELYCPSCRRNAIIKIIIIKKWITFFFLPVFSYSKKRFRVCESCGYSAEMQKE
ncbi:MAG: zinc-ribbon domain-containing protein [Ignavibacteria bacterium]|nr:zinc-ribbon domain-containing protein [Ignavibacteria bacterium]